MAPWILQGAYNTQQKISADHRVSTDENMALI